jgi:hypothetical protein
VRQPDTAIVMVCAVASLCAKTTPTLRSTGYANVRLTPSAREEKMYQTVTELQNDIKTIEPSELAKKWLENPLPYVFSQNNKENEFINIIKSDWPDSEKIKVVGSGNWRYSLNPWKYFSEFSDKSDIDTVIISEKHFNEIWCELRSIHRKNWYLWDHDQQDEINRNGQNIYAGFITPKWIPERRSPIRYHYVVSTQRYQSHFVGYRKVGLMFFKNETEAIDYYKRGIMIVRSKYGI